MFIDKIEKAILLKQLQTVIGVVERKQPLPILSNVLIEKRGSSLQLTTTDLEIQISSQLNDHQQINTDEAITVGAKKLQEILRVSPEDSKISLEIKDNKVQIKINKSRFTLQTLPPTDFPKISVNTTESHSFHFSQEKLKKMINMVQYAMAQQDIRYYLNGVLLVIDETSLKLIATDGHRLAFVETKINIENPKFKQEIILPRKTINELVKLLSDTDEPIKFNLAENQAQMHFSNISLITKIIDGKFPDYNRVIPKYTNHLTLNKVLIIQALQRAAILSNEKFKGIRFVLTEKNLRLISSNNEQEESQEDIETDYMGIALDIGFNVNYLLDGLNNIQEETVIFSFGDANSSILLTIPENESFKYVVMPMRI